MFRSSNRCHSHHSDRNTYEMITGQYKQQQQHQQQIHHGNASTTCRGGRRCDIGMDHNHEFNHTSYDSLMSSRPYTISLSGEEQALHNITCSDLESGNCVASVTDNEDEDREQYLLCSSNTKHHNDDHPKLQHRYRRQSNYTSNGHTRTRKGVRNHNHADLEYDTSHSSSNGSSGSVSNESSQSICFDQQQPGTTSNSDAVRWTKPKSFRQRMTRIPQHLFRQLYRISCSIYTTLTDYLPYRFTTTTTTTIYFPQLRHAICTMAKCQSRKVKKPCTVPIAFRKIQTSDKEQIRQLHELWFPVKYVDEFYDDLVQERMSCTGDPLFTSVGTTFTPQHHISSSMTSIIRNTTTVTNPQQLPQYTSLPSSSIQMESQKEEKIVACVVGCFIKASTLSGQLQKLLIKDVQQHPRLFYIMTVGTTIRHQGVGTIMIEQCIQQVQQDPSCGVLYLHVLITNIAAIQMYEQLGFDRVIEIPDYYTIDDVRYNCYLYAKYYNGNQGQQHRSVSSSWMTVWDTCIQIPTKWKDSISKYFRTLHPTNVGENEYTGGN
jgi:histone acetyltransferase MCC1